MRWRALACDYDRTLTDGHLRPDPQAMRALERARRAGLRVLVVSGRPLGFLREAVPQADVVVAENGAVRWDARSVWRAPWPGRRAVLDALRAAGVPHEHEPFEVLVSLPRLPEGQLRGLLGAASPGPAAIANVDSLMLLPAGVDKGTGLLAALGGLGVPAGDCAAVGDGENDLPMVEAAGLGAAVANAVPELKARADVALRGAYGAGVAELVDLLLAGRP